VATASAPASSANLGPGFDVIALALELRCSVAAEAAEAWETRQVGPECPVGEADLVLEAARRAVGPHRPLRLTIDNCIPIGKGLGSSAAAATAGAAAAWRAVGAEPDPSAVFELVAVMEGHPDNAAASVYGGLVVCSPAGVHRLALHPDLVPLVAVPSRPLPTTEARALLDPTVPRPVVVRSTGRIAALVAGLLTGERGLLAAAAGDELHEEPRNRLRPEVTKLIGVAREAGALHACWSGAGPSVLALVHREEVSRVAAALAASGDGRVIEFQVAERGLSWSA
jgi:homoserine kinase